VNDFDHAAGFATQAAPEVVTARLTARAGEAFRFREWFTTRAIPLPGGPARTPDLVAILDARTAPDQPALLIHEFQSEHDEEKLETTLVEAAVFRAYARHGPEKKGKFRVFAGLVYLKGECPGSVLDMRSPNGSGTLHQAFVWNVALDSAEQALERVALRPECWGLLFWIALMTGAEKDSIIQRWLELVLNKVQDARMRKTLVVVALTFAELTGRTLVWEPVLKEVNMGESQVFNRIRAEGELKNAREWLVDLLQAKYKGALSADLAQTVAQQTEIAVLKRWHRSALEQDTWEGFVASLK
jgi:hypothetical protein